MIGHGEPLHRRGVESLLKLRKLVGGNPTSIVMHGNHKQIHTLIRPKRNVNVEILPKDIPMLNGVLQQRLQRKSQNLRIMQFFRHVDGQVDMIFLHGAHETHVCQYMFLLLEQQRQP